MTRQKISVDPKHPQSELAKRLQVDKDLDAGGVCVIKVATDRNLLRQVALKKILPEYTEHPTMRGRLIEEAQITSQLNHPNIVSVHELGVDKKDELFFTMDLIEGKTLKAFLKEINCQDRTARELFDHLQMFLKICDAIAYAHSHGVLHRDLKPTNIMVGDFGAIYVMDWGLARQKDRRPIFEESTINVKEDSQRYMVETNHPLGTWPYMAPEQAGADDSIVDERTDVFLLGGLLYEILAHVPPYEAKTMDELKEKVMSAVIDWPYERTNAYLPPPLCRITMKALMRAKVDRYQSVLELKDAVESYMYGGGQFETRRYQTGESIIRQGETGNEAFIIAKGRCSVFVTRDGENKPLREMGEGEIFGETAVLTDEPRTASVQAIVPTEVLVITAADFDEGLKSGTWLAKLLKVLASRFKEKDARVQELERELERLRPETSRTSS